MRFLEELENAILDENFYKTNEVIEKIRENENAFEYLNHLFTILENNPDVDYGMPGPVVHFMEMFYKKGYEELLLESVRRKPTNHTVWMVNRIMNVPNLDNKDKYMKILKSLLSRDDISESLREEIITFLNYGISQK